jgi:SAM-dependent methyltransferase
MMPGTTPESGAYHLPADEATAVMERRRLLAMAELLDPETRRRIESLGLASGWHCLEVGPGAGTVSEWLGQRVGERGEVVSLDLDLRFHVEVGPPVTRIEADLMQAPLPRDHFQLAHARAVIEHLPDPLAALTRMVECLAPGGWLVVEDGDFITVDEAPVAEPFRRLHAAATAAGLLRSPHWNRRYGSRLLGDLQALALEDVEIDGTLRTMIGGTRGAESYLLGLEFAVPGLVAAGLIDEAIAREALLLARRPDFRLPSPLHVIGVGRKPMR